MKEFSGGISNPNFKSEDISTKNPEINLINEYSPNAQEDEDYIIPNAKSEINNLYPFFLPL